MSEESGFLLAIPPTEVPSETGIQSQTESSGPNMRPDFSQPEADETEQKTGGPDQRPIPSHQEGESTKAPEQPFSFADEGENESEMPQQRGDLVAVSSTTFVPDSPRDATAFDALRNNILPTPLSPGWS